MSVLLNLLNLPAIPALRKLAATITQAMAEMPVVQSLLDIIKQQHEAIQKLKDEIAGLKGHKGRPEIPKSVLREKEKEEKKAAEAQKKERKAVRLCQAKENERAYDTPCGAGEGRFAVYPTDKPTRRRGLWFRRGSGWR